MKKSREIRSLEILALTAVLGWKLCFPTDAPATQLAKANDKAKTDITLTPAQSTEAIADLRRRSLLFPITGFDIERVKSSYTEARGGKPHEAIDILAPRNTPVLAVDDGKIAKLFMSKPGGTTIYQYDPSKKYIYYYAHLERYADGLANNQAVKKGQGLRLCRNIG